jgi:hypothetical protein
MSNDSKDYSLAVENREKYIPDLILTGEIMVVQQIVCKLRSGDGPSSSFPSGG